MLSEIVLPADARARLDLWAQVIGGCVRSDERDEAVPIHWSRDVVVPENNPRSSQSNDGT